jgi:cyclophilin family peptidyl-prolyl cis-trans isomerase
MAREAPGTAVADFSIVVGDLVSMDGTPDGSNPGYAVFGKVVEGTDTVDKIKAVATGNQRGMGDVPTTAVVIEKAERVG